MFSICGFEMIAHELPLVTEAGTFTGMPRAEEPAINGTTVPWSTLSFVVVGEKGFFQKEDLKVRMISFRGTNVLMAALERGSQFDVKMAPDDLNQAMITIFARAAQAPSIGKSSFSSTARQASRVSFPRP
jgi:ABC-type nitrate/sulfonate/bicarbonate transport system substrate-binding protein